MSVMCLASWIDGYAVLICSLLDSELSMIELSVSL